MNLTEFAKEIHENAKAHGWWNTERPYSEVVALIHSEWSEALEEYRAGRPMIWHACKANEKDHPCEACPDCMSKKIGSECIDFDKKPEGIAVELIDGCIRILDYLCHIKYDQIDFDAEKDIQDMSKKNPKGIEVPSLIALLHRQTAKSIESPYWFVMAMRYVFAWITANGMDPEAIMREKHAYNITRPYKHGGKVC